MQNADVPKLKITSGSIEGTLYYGCLTKVKVTVENPTDIELTGGFAPTLYSPTLQTFAFLGESVLLTVAPHSSVSREWITSFNAMTNSGDITTATPYVLTFMDEDTYNVYSADVWKSVTMQPNPGKPTVSLSSNVKVGNASYSSTATEDIFTIASANSIDVSTTLKLGKGFFAYPVMATLCTMGSGGSANILTYSGSSVVLTNAGDTYDFSTSIAYPQAEEGVDYYILMVYDAGSQLYPIYGTKATIVRLDLSGVENVAAEGSELSLKLDNGSDSLVASSAAGIARIELYSTGGALLKAVDSDTASLADMPRGIIIALARDKAGNTRTLKIAR